MTGRPSARIGFLFLVSLVALAFRSAQSPTPPSPAASVEPIAAILDAFRSPTG